jgi:hypothetical protein
MRSVRYRPAWRAALPLLAGLACGPAGAQVLIEGSERLGDDRPEAWAMNRATAASVMTGFGEPVPAAGEWRVAADLAQVPWLDATQRRVGFDGTKEEDLNKSPVFGRVRAQLGLPHGFGAELGWTPPVRHDGARADALVAIALAKRWSPGGTLALTARVFAQHGDIVGDITCPARLAGLDDPEANRYGCRAPSRDRVSLNHHGAELTLAGGGAWRWHVGAGLVRSEAQVQVDALVYDAHDRTRLWMRDTRPFVAAGVRHAWGRRWSVAAEVLHMPMSRRVGPGDGHGHAPGAAHDDPRPVADDAYTGLRLQLAWSPRR